MVGQPFTGLAGTQAVALVVGIREMPKMGIEHETQREQRGGVERRDTRIEC